MLVLYICTFCCLLFMFDIFSTLVAICRINGSVASMTATPTTLGFVHTL